MLACDLQPVGITLIRGRAKADFSDFRTISSESIFTSITAGCCSTSDYIAICFVTQLTATDLHTIGIVFGNSSIVFYGNSHG